MKGMECETWRIKKVTRMKMKATKDGAAWKAMTTGCGFFSFCDESSLTK